MAKLRVVLMLAAGSLVLTAPAAGANGRDRDGDEQHTCDQGLVGGPCCEGGAEGDGGWGRTSDREGGGGAGWGGGCQLIRLG